MNKRAIIIGAGIVALIIGAAILTAPAQPDRYIWIIDHRALDVSTGRVIDDRTLNAVNDNDVSQRRVTTATDKE
jgi:hypothetical protein